MGVIYAVVVQTWNNDSVGRQKNRNLIEGKNIGTKCADWITSWGFPEGTCEGLTDNQASSRKWVHWASKYGL